MSSVLDSGNTWKEVLKRRMVYIEANLIFNDISSHLIRDNVLTQSQIAEIKKASSSLRFQAERLLAHLNRRTEHDFKAFVKILETCGYDHLATKIKETKHSQPDWHLQLQQNQVIIVKDLDVQQIKSELIQKSIINETQAEEILSQPDPTSESAKIRCFLDHLCCRSEKDFFNFLDCLTTGFKHVREEVERELAQLVAENDEDKKPFWRTAINNKRARLSSDLVIRHFSDCLLEKCVLDQDKLEECTNPEKRTRKTMARAFVEVLSTREKHHFDLFMNILQETDNSHLAKELKSAEEELRRQQVIEPEPHPPAQDTLPHGDTARQLNYADGLPSGRRSTDNPVDAVSGSLGNMQLDTDNDTIDAPNRHIDEIVPEPEQGSGFSVRFRLPKGEKVVRRFKFNMTVLDMIKVVRTYENATNNIKLVVAGGITIQSNNPDKALLSRTLKECKITADTIIDVIWIQENEGSNVFVSSHTASEPYQHSKN